MLLPVMESSRFGDHAEAGEDHADGAGVQEELAMQQQGGGAGGAIRDKPVKVIPCPRCQSMNTKFCYYNNYSVTQPRHFCRNCQRYWTVGGTLRNVPVGGGSRKKTRTRSRSDPYHVPAYDNAGGATTGAPPQSDSFLSGMQHLSMLAPPSLGFMNFPTSAPFLLDGLYNPRQKPLAGLQEVPDMQSLFDQAPQVPQIPPVAPPMLLNNMNFFHAPQQQATFQPQASEPLASVMAKAGLWSQTPTVEPPSWEMDPQKKTSALHGVGGYGHLLAESLKQQPGFWPAGCVADDRLVPHASWDDSNPSTTHNTPNLSPNGSSTTDSMANPGRSTTFYYEDVSQPWAGILNGF